MRNFLVFLIVTIFLSVSSPSSAAEAFLGKIVSIDRGKNEMAVEVVGGPTDKGSEASSRKITVHFSSDQIRSDMEPGTVVRVWGKYNQTNPMMFESNAIRKGFDMEDPTGVRSRISRCRDMGGMSGSACGQR